MSARITRSKDELRRLTAILESEDYDTDDQMAYALLKEAAAILTERHLFVVWSRRYPDVGWGPYYTEGQAKEAWLGSIGPALGQEGGGIIPIAPWDVTPLVSGIELPTDRCACGHPRWRHTTEGKRLYCGPSAKRTKEPCHCGGFTNPERKG